MIYSVFIVDGATNLKWSYFANSIRWNHLYNNRLFSNNLFLYSNYHYKYSINEGLRNFSWKSQITNIGLKADYDLFLTKNHIKYGLQAMNHFFSPGQTISNDTSINVKIVKLEERKALELGCYISDEIKLTDNFSLSLGFRFSFFAHIGPGYSYNYSEYSETFTDSLYHNKNKLYNAFSSFEPRLGISYKLSENSSFKMSYNKMVQYIQLLSNSSIGMPTDIWFPVGIF